jgi:polyhydroxybutyrate depolymerase
MRAAILLASLVACATTRPQTAVRLKAGARTVDHFTPGDFEVELVHGGRDRFYLVHVPPQAATGASLPVVMAFHGGGGTASRMPFVTNLSAVANEHGFIAVYPGGTGNPNFGRHLLAWNAGFCCGLPRDEHVDDVGFALAVLRDVAARTPVDHTRVYATGISNGGFMSYRLAIELSDRIAAIAPIAGALPDVPTGTQPVAVMHFHSKDDPSAVYAGGLGRRFNDRQIPFPAVEPVVEAWAKHNGCAPTRPDVVDRRTSHGGAHTATKLAYVACPTGAEVVFWQLSGPGHVWPGGPDLSIGRFVGESTDVVDASREMWSFFAQHSKPNAPPLSRPQPADPATLDDAFGSLPE